MGQFVANQTDFSVACAQCAGHCTIARENVRFMDQEQCAVSDLQMKCGHIVIVPDPSNKGGAFLYRTSCRRMADLVDQMFRPHLEAPKSLRQHCPEMTLGDLQCQRVDVSVEDCRAIVERFAF
jgi:hypothetical protein